MDGVIDIDPVAMSYVLQVLGPMTAPPYPQTITASNILIELNDLVNLPSGPGKPFFSAFGSKVVGDMLHTPLNKMPALATVLERGASEKHVVLFFNDPSLEKLVDGANFGGEVRAPLRLTARRRREPRRHQGGPLVSRSYSLSATVSSDGNVSDRLVLHYVDPMQTDANNRYLERSSGGDYRDYVRVYVPETATLTGMTLSVDGATSRSIAPEAITYELSREAIGYWLVVPYGGSATLTLDYSGPFADISVSPERYALVWEKQVNALTWPVRVAVTMPSGRSYRWSAALMTDRTWSAQA